MTIAVIGLDLAKSVFQAHGVDQGGGTVLVKRAEVHAGIPNVRISQVGGQVPDPES